MRQARKTDRITRRREKFTIRTYPDRSNGGRVRRNDAHVTGGDFYELYMARGPARKRNPLGRQAAQSLGVVGRLVRRHKSRRLCKLEDAHTILQDDYDAFLRQLGTPYWRQGTDVEG